MKSPTKPAVKDSEQKEKKGRFFLYINLSVAETKSEVIVLDEDLLAKQMSEIETPQVEERVSKKSRTRRKKEDVLAGKQETPGYICISLVISAHLHLISKGGVGRVR
jgi:hypothetical protein